MRLCTHRGTVAILNEANLTTSATVGDRLCNTYSGGIHGLLDTFRKTKYTLERFNSNWPLEKSRDRLVLSRH